MEDIFIKKLKEDERVLEGYVLIREIKLILDVGHEYFYPRFKIRIWIGTHPSGYPYGFELSHHVRTPTQAGPYHPSHTNFETEEEAVSAGIAAIRSYIVEAIKMGHKPDQSWLIENDDF